MIRKVLIALSLLLLVGAAYAASHAYTITVSTTFTPLHTYFIAASGCDDANAGTSAGSPWCTPNHAVVCGDVIIAAAGTYSTGQFQSWGTVSSCPSVSGGIDGTGGINFAVLLCGGSDLVSCNATTNAFNAVFQWSNNNSNWAVEGFTIPNSNTSNGFGIQIVDCNNSTKWVSHHIAAINNVVYNSLQSFGLSDCGVFGGVNPPAADYLAVVGMISQNGAQNTVCLGSIDLVGTGKTDSATTQVKAIVAGSYAYHARNAGCNARFDNEGFIFDSLDAHSSNGIWNFYNNMAWDNSRYGFDWTWGAQSSQVLTGNIFNNTFFANMASAITNDSIGGEIQFGNADNSIYTINIYKNVSKTNWPLAGSTGTTPIYAQDITGNWTLMTIGGTGGLQNIFKGKQTACILFNGNSTCDAGFNVESNDMTNIGTNIYTDPLYTSESDILTAKWTSTAPDCTGFENVAQCMGYDAVTGTLTANTPISDLQSGCGSCSGKGYQLPSMSCVSSGDYFTNFPTWLKGIVYLHWTGSIVQQRAGLLTMPCAV